MKHARPDSLNRSWEHARDLQLHRSHILRCWPGTPSHHRQTNVYTARCASGPLTANYGGLGVKSSSLPGTASYHAPSGFTAPPLPLYPPGRTFGTRPAIVFDGWAKFRRASRPTPPPLTLTSSASSMIRARSRILYSHPFKPFHGARPKDPGAFSVVRPED